ncbi:MAG TPA: hypothetical protein VKU41_29775 [Polyangiaceae bacterium]|nr:hypothetical protein [Polyangiaceae bacterium]
MRNVAVEGDELVLRADDHDIRLGLGARLAELWAKLIKEPKGLFEKLELGLPSRVAVVDVTDGLFVAGLRERTAAVVEGRVPEGAPIIFFGAETRDALRKVPLLRARMAQDGVMWIIRPKGSRAISEGDVFDTLRTSGLVDTKVVALSKTHTAHKCVIPVELRGQAIPRPPIVSLPPPPPGSPAPKKGGGNAKSTPPTRSASKAPKSVPPKNDRKRR